MRKKLIAIPTTIFIVFMISVPFASALVNLQFNDTKGAFAKWDLPNDSGVGHTVVYALLTQSNNGKDGALNLIIMHFLSANGAPRVSTANIPADFKWNMDKITIDVNQANIPWGSGSRQHNITISFDGFPKSQAPDNLPTGITVNGDWKLAQAELIVDGNAGTHSNHGNADPFSVDDAFIFHGDLSMNF